MNRNILLATGAGAVSALASVAVATGTAGALFIVYLAPLPLLLVGLGAGPRVAALSAASGFLVAGLMGGTVAAGLFGLMHALPAWLVTRQALGYRTAANGTVIWYPAGAVLSWLTLLGAALLLAAGMALWGQGGVEAAIRSHLDEAFRAMAPELASDDREVLLDGLTSFFPAAVGVSWVIMTVINAMLAQGILSHSGRNLRPTPNVDDLRLPDWASWLLVGAAALALLGSGDLEYIGRNLTVLMAVPFFFMGLALAHAMARLTAYGTLMLAAFYLLLLALPGAILAVAAAGVVEQWVGVRKRLPVRTNGVKPGNGEEN